MVHPICDLNTLWEWEGKEESDFRSRKLVNFRDKLKQKQPEILVCHDMKGGYLEEESDDGVVLAPGSRNPYVFLNWWNIDIFCYFSHYFITIPPIGYTNVAHDHGCLVLGTFITEGIEGTVLCESIFASEDTVKKTVQSLACIATAYNFNGWLINIENNIKMKQLENLKLFLRLLTDEMRKKIEFSRVIWYDSVTALGMLHWQNRLNELNKVWYECCDGIYLNYNWTDEMLLSSADFGSINRIFVGIDVFARGCIGGWDCYRAFAKANLMRMSIALFAPGWITEKFPDADPIEQGLRFWRKLAIYVPVRPILGLPISTNFRSGFVKCSEGYKFCLGLIDLQPHFSRLLQEEPVPVKTGGVLLRRNSCTRLFCFDVSCSGCRITIHAQRKLDVLVNDVVVQGTTKGDEIIVAIQKPFHLRSLHLSTDDIADCQLFQVTVEEIFIAEHC